MRLAPHVHLRAMQPPGFARADFDTFDQSEPVDDRVSDAATEQFIQLIRAVVAEGEDEERGGR